MTTTAWKPSKQTLRSLISLLAQIDKGGQEGFTDCKFEFFDRSVHPIRGRNAHQALTIHEDLSGKTLMTLCAVLGPLGDTTCNHKGHRWCKNCVKVAKELGFIGRPGVVIPANS